MALMAITYTPQGHIDKISLNSVADAKLTLKELRLEKKEYGVQKREITAQMAEVRANLRGKNANRAPAIRIPGTLGKVMRASNQISRAGDRASTNSQIVALESQKKVFDEHIARVDAVILQVERWVLQNRLLK